MFFMRDHISCITSKVGFENDFPFPKVEHVNFLEGKIIVHNLTQLVTLCQILLSLMCNFLVF